MDDDPRFAPVGAGLSRSGRARKPLGGGAQLGGAGQRFRAAPRACERLLARPRRRPRRRSAAPPRTGAASAPGPAGARAPARATPRFSRRRFIAARRRGSDGSTSAPIASIVCSAWPSISDITACMRSTSCQRSSPSVNRSSSPRRARSSSSRSSPGSGSLGHRPALPLPGAIWLRRPASRRRASPAARRSAL